MREGWDTAGSGSATPLSSVNNLPQYGINMKKVNTKTVRVKEYRDYSKGGTPQERHMENVERGYTTTGLTAVAVKYEEIDGKMYKVITL